MKHVYCRLIYKKKRIVCFVILKKKNTLKFYPLLCNFETTYRGSRIVLMRVIYMEWAWKGHLQPDKILKNDKKWGFRNEVTIWHC